MRIGVALLALLLATGCRSGASPDATYERPLEEQPYGRSQVYDPWRYYERPHYLAGQPVYERGCGGR